MIEFLKAFYPILIKYLMVTIVIEEIGLLIQREKNYKIYIACLIVNIITNISLNILLQYLSDNYYLFLVILEIVIFIIEAFVYYLVNKNIVKSIRLSLICNLLSLLIGSLI